MARRRINQAQPDALFPRGQRPRDRMTPAATDRGATFRQPSDPRNTQQTRGGMGLNPDQLREMYDALPGRARAEFLAQHPAFNPTRATLPPVPGSDSGVRPPFSALPGSGSGARGPQPHGWGLQQQGYSPEEARRIKAGLQQGGMTRDQFLAGADPNVNQTNLLPEQGTAFTSGSPWRFWYDMQRQGNQIPPPPVGDQVAMMAWNDKYRGPQQGGTTWNYDQSGNLVQMTYDQSGWHPVQGQAPAQGPQNAQRPPQGQGNQNPAPGATLGTPGVSPGTQTPGLQVHQPPPPVPWQPPQVTVPPPTPFPQAQQGYVPPESQGQYGQMNYNPQTGQWLGSGDSRFVDPNTGQPIHPQDLQNSQMGPGPDPRQGFGPQPMGLVPASHAPQTMGQTYGPQQVPPGSDSGARPPALPPGSDSGARPPSLPPGSDSGARQGGLPLSGDFEAYRRAAEDNLAGTLSRIGIARDQIPAMTNLIIQRLRTDENETNDAIAEASNARGVRGQRDFDRADVGFSRQRQDIALDVASQLADLADQESGAHSKYLKDLAEGILNYGRDLASDPRAPVDRTNNDEPVKRRRRAGQRNRNRRRRGK